MNEVLHKLKLLTGVLVIIACSVTIYGFKTGYDVLYHKPPKEENTNTFICGNMMRYSGNEKGAQLFKNHCNSCHLMGRSMTGPNLEMVMERVSSDWFYTLLNNPDSLRQIQDPYFEGLLEKWEPKSGSHPVIQLNRSEVNDLIDYVSY